MELSPGQAVVTEEVPVVVVVVVVVAVVVVGVAAVAVETCWAAAYIDRGGVTVHRLDPKASLGAGRVLATETTAQSLAEAIPIGGGRVAEPYPRFVGYWVPAFQRQWGSRS